jgi:sirohydrochlorin cobaltochelatase
MKAKTAIKLLVLLALVFLYAHGDKRPMKKGILLVAFGSTIPEAQVSFDNIEQSVKKGLPGVPVYWSYTSRIIIKKMAKELLSKRWLRRGSTWLHPQRPWPR